MTQRCCHSVLVAVVGSILALGGCDVLTFDLTDFPNAESGDEGQIWVLDDLREIANDPDLTEEEKREAYAQLGIEDEDLIAALLTLAP
jgi:hypothetical protein